jgi:predicted protein tyrosine phosphatase
MQTSLEFQKALCKSLEYVVENQRIIGIDIPDEVYWFECAKVSLLTQYVDDYISEWQYDWLLKKLVCNA